jgi:hypothetical protein
VLRVVLDTTVLVNDYLLQRPDSRALLEACAQGICIVHVPSVVMAEAGRRHEEDIGEAERVATTRLRDFEVGRFGLGGDLTARLREGVEQRRLAYPRLLGELCASPNVEVDPWPSADHVEVVSRDLSRRKPFRQASSGSIGYRDTLIWLGVLELVARHPADTFVLVSNNRTDFGAQGEPYRLHPALVEDLVDRGHAPDKVYLVATLAEVLRVHIVQARAERAGRPDQVRAAVIMALHEYNNELRQMSWSSHFRDGQLVVPDVDADLPPDMADVKIAAIQGPYDVEIEPDGIAADGLHRFLCRHVVTITFDGSMDKGNYYSQSHDDVHAWADLDSHTVSVEATRSIALTTNLSYSEENDAVTNVTLTAAERAPLRE